MTVAELIALLSKYPQDAVVVFHDEALTIEDATAAALNTPAPPLGAIDESDGSPYPYPPLA